jgi:hypothetical protein
MKPGLILSAELLAINGIDDLALVSPGMLPQRRPAAARP